MLFRDFDDHELLTYIHVVNGILYSKAIKQANNDINNINENNNYNNFPD